MRRFFPLIIAVAPTLARAELEVPRFNKGGVLLQLQGGGGVPHLDQGELDRQFTPFIASRFYSQVKTDGMAGFRAGYNILGHATIALDFTATGWNVFNANRGGAGFLIGLVAWHPLELFFLNKEVRPFGLDFSTWVGLGYGIAGTSGPPALGMDGLIVQWGFDIVYYLGRYFGLAFFTKSNFLRWNTFYFDWDSAHQSPPVPGASASINPVGNGTWWAVGAAVVLRIGD